MHIIKMRIDIYPSRREVRCSISVGLSGGESCALLLADKTEECSVRCAYRLFAAVSKHAAKRFS